MSMDLFIRRAYTHKGVTVPVDIDLVRGVIALVEKDGTEFSAKRWIFADRGLEYMNGWIIILEAMQSAVTEASKVLKEAKDKSLEEFADMLISLDDKSLDFKGGKKKK